MNVIRKLFKFEHNLWRNIVLFKSSSKLNVCQCFKISPELYFFLQRKFALLVYNFVEI